MDVHIRDNENYLYSNFTTISFSQPSRAIDTVYQNTSGKIREVLITVTVDEGTLHAKIGTANPPSSTVGIVSGNSVAVTLPLTFQVPPNYYYTASAISSSPTLSNWTEYDLH
jgi:hypothetical protein